MPSQAAAEGQTASMDSKATVVESLGGAQSVVVRRA
jgi:hypothetical protein